MPGQQQLQAKKVGTLCDSASELFNATLDICPNHYLDPKRDFPDSDEIAAVWRFTIEAARYALMEVERLEILLRKRAKMEPNRVERSPMVYEYMPWENDNMSGG